MLPVIDHTHKYILFWSPRVGCTSTKQFFAEMNGLTLPAGVGIHQFIDEIQLPNLKYDGPAPNYKNSFRCSFEPYHDYQKILFIRDPFSRLVSAFTVIIAPYCEAYINLSPEEFIKKLASHLYFAVYRDKPPSLGVQKAMLDFQKNPTFKNFVNILVLIPRHMIEHHFGPQVSPYHFQEFPLITELTFDKVVRLENLSDELDKIAKFHNKAIAIPRANAGHYTPAVGHCISDTNIPNHLRTVGRFPNWPDFYDDETRAMVQEFFAADLAVYALSFAALDKKELTERLRLVMFNQDHTRSIDDKANIDLKTFTEQTLFVHKDLAVGIERKQLAETELKKRMESLTETRRTQQLARDLAKVYDSAHFKKEVPIAASRDIGFGAGAGAGADLANASRSGWGMVHQYQKQAADASKYRFGIYSLNALNTSSGVILKGL